MAADDQQDAPGPGSTPLLGPAQLAEASVFARGIVRRVSEMSLDLAAAESHLRAARRIARKGGGREVDAATWHAWNDLANAAAALGKLAALAEADLRQQAGGADRLLVAGVKVATRVVFSTPVKPFDWRQDILRRAGAASTRR